MRCRTYGPIDEATTMFEGLSEGDPDYIDVGEDVRGRKKLKSAWIGMEIPSRIRYPKYMGEGWYFHTSIVEKALRSKERKAARRKAHWEAYNRKRMNTHCGLPYKQVISIATPRWITIGEREELKRIKSEAKRLTRVTGIEHNVDHVIPLRGELVCGLHIPSNIRITLKRENEVKSNSYVVE